MKGLFLIIASAMLVSPVSAAEVGSRHVHGHTTSTVTNGRSVTESRLNGSYSERSNGASSAGSYRRRESGTFSSLTNESFNFGSNTTSTFTENSTFSR